MTSEPGAKEARGPRPACGSESTASATELKQELGALVRAVSHDFRAPLRAITTFGGLLQEQSGQLEGPLAESVGHMVLAATRLESMVEGWLALARADDGSPPVDVALDTVLQAERRRVEPIVVERKGTLTLQPLGIVVGQPAPLTRLFDALVDNALTFTHAPPVVVVEGRTEGAFHVVTVRDEGIGFEPQHESRIFELFQRLHTAEEFPGVGAGLAVSKKIAELHGGRITATSSLGDGAVFEVWLPTGAAPQTAP